MVFLRTLPKFLQQPTREERTPLKAKKEGRGPLKLSCPTSLFESNGELYIVDYDKIYKVLRNGHVVVIAGGGKEIKDGKPAHESKLEGPYGICISSRNEVFIRTSASSGNNGDGIALECKLEDPCGIFVNDLDQIIFVDDSKIRMIQDGTLKTLLSDEYFTRNVQQDECGTIYFTTRDSVSKLLPNGTVEACERKPMKQAPGKIYSFTETKFHEPFDIKIRNGIVHYSERLFLRSFDPKTGNDSIFAKLESVQKPLVKMMPKKHYVSIWPCSDGSFYMSDDMRGTVWIAGPTAHSLKELMVKSEIAFNFKDYPHIGPRRLRIERCKELSDISFSFVKHYN